MKGQKNLTQLHTKVTPHDVDIDYTHDQPGLPFSMEEFMSVGTQKELEVFQASHICMYLVVLGDELVSCLVCGSEM